MFNDIMSNMASLMKDDNESTSTKDAADKDKKDDDSGPSIFSRFWTAMTYTMKYMVGGIKPDMYTDIGTITGLPFSFYKSDIYQPPSPSN